MTQPANSVRHVQSTKATTELPGLIATPVCTAPCLSGATVVLPRAQVPLVQGLGATQCAMRGPARGAGFAPA
jgi:hypothetical protein